MTTARAVAECVLYLLGLPKLPSIGEKALSIPLRDEQYASFPGDSVVKNSLPEQKMQVRSLGWEDLLEKEMAIHSSTLAWEIPWTEEPGGLQSTGPQKSWTQLSDQTTTAKFLWAGRQAGSLKSEKSPGFTVRFWILVLHLVQTVWLRQVT